MDKLPALLRRIGDNQTFLLAAAAVFLAGTPTLIVVLATQPVPALPAAVVPAVAPAPATSPTAQCVQLVVVDSQPPTLVCVPADQAG